MRKIQNVHRKEDPEGDTVCAEGELKYFIFPEKIAREKYNYPGIEAFFMSCDMKNCRNVS